MYNVFAEHWGALKFFPTYKGYNLDLYVKEIKIQESVPFQFGKNAVPYLSFYFPIKFDNTKPILLYYCGRVGITLSKELICKLSEQYNFVSFNYLGLANNSVDFDPNFKDLEKQEEIFFNNLIKILQEKEYYAIKCEREIYQKIILLSFSLGTILGFNRAVKAEKNGTPLQYLIMRGSFFNKALVPKVMLITLQHSILLSLRQHYCLVIISSSLLILATGMYFKGEWLYRTGLSLNNSVTKVKLPIPKVAAEKVVNFLKIIQIKSTTNSVKRTVEVLNIISKILIIFVLMSGLILFIHITKSFLKAGPVAIDHKEVSLLKKTQVILQSIMGDPFVPLEELEKFGRGEDGKLPPNIEKIMFTLPGDKEPHVETIKLKEWPPHIDPPTTLLEKHYDINALTIEECIRIPT